MTTQVRDDGVLLRGLLVRDIRRDLRRHLRPLLAWYALFTLFATTAAIPLTTWSLAGLLHWIERPLSGDLYDLAANLLGLAWLLLALAAAWYVVMLQQAGTLLVSAARGSHYRAALGALLGMLRRAGALAALAALQVAAHALLALPWLAGSAALYLHLLGGFDPYYVVMERPPALRRFAALAAPLLAAGLLIHATLYFRWLLATPALVLESLSPRAALARSGELTRGRHGRIALLVVAVALGVALLPLAVTEFYDRIASPLLGWLPEHRLLVGPGVVIYLTVYAASTLAVVFLGTTLNNLLVRALFLRLAGAPETPLPGSAPARPGRLVWGVEAGLLCVALVQAVLAVSSMNLRQEVTVTAHRGSSADAPENTLAAFDRAIAAGADHIEFDVRLTADGEVIVFHDADFLRTAGVARSVVETTLDEARRFDVGSWFDPAFADQRIVTLGEALVHVDRRAGLWVELKPDPHNAQALLDAAVAVIRERGMQDSAVIASLSPSLVRLARERAPDVRVALFATAMPPGLAERTGFDVLGLNHVRLTLGEVARARRQGYALQVWTVNDPLLMERYMDMGVDDISTDLPAEAVRVRAQREALTDVELLLVRLRSWLRA